MSNSAAQLGDPWALSSDPFQFVVPVSRLALTGPDSLRVLHGQTTQALEGTPLGERRLSCGVTATARLRALVEVEATAEGALLLVTAGAGGGGGAPGGPGFGCWRWGPGGGGEFGSSWFRAGRLRPATQLWAGPGASGLGGAAGAGGTSAVAARRH